MPCGQKTKTENRNNIVTNSIKTLKMVHIQKKKILKKNTIICYLALQKTQGSWISKYAGVLYFEKW